MAILHKNTVLCLDSGIGGLAYLKELRQIAPQLNWVYLADSAYFPFGDKEPEQLCEHICQVIGKALQSYPVSIVILLCNTATIWALKELRSRFPQQKFIGTVPAIKPAAAASRRRKIVMLASYTTSKASYVEALHRDFAADCELKAIDASKLIEFIEREWPEYLIRGTLQQENMNEALAPYVAKIREMGADQVVLGCTHFLHLKKELKSALQKEDKDIFLCDSLQGVCSRLSQVLEPAAEEPSKDILLYTSGVAQAQILRHWEFWAKNFRMQLKTL